MSKVTLVLEYEDGKEPVLHSRQNILGGELVGIVWQDHEESTKNKIKNIMQKHWGEVPSCGESLFQDCTYESDRECVIDDICKIFNIYEEDEND